MPEHRVKGPDGKIYKVTAPDGATDDEIIAYARANARQEEPAQPERSTGDELLRQGGLFARYGINAALGLPALLTDAATGISNSLFGTHFKAQLPEVNRQLTRLGLPEPEGKGERIIGDVTTAIGGVGASAKAAQLGPEAVKKLFNDRLVTQILSAGTGQTASSITREEGGSQAAQVGAGIAGSLAPTAIQMAARGVFPNLTQAGRADTKGRLLNEAAGKQRDDVLKGLDQKKSYVPGEQPTAAQAASEANSPTFAALEREVTTKYRPDLRLGREQANEAARLDAVREVGGKPGALDSAINLRETTANQNYGKAYSTLINSDPELRAIFKDPFIRKEVPDALELLKGKPVGDNLTQFLQNVKIGLDQKLAKTGNDALSSAQKSATQESKDALLSWLDKRNPAYQTARETYAQQSVPVNQMQIGQLLESKLKAPLTGNERPAAFAQSLRDAPRTIKNANGGTYNLLEDVLSQQQMGRLQGIKSSLEREANVADQARLGSKAAQALLGEKTLEAPQLLDRAVTATRFVLEKVGVSTKNKTLAELAKDIQDPTLTAKLMREATPNQLAAMREVIKATLPAATLGNAQVKNANSEHY
jgi:hypothetical protein